MIIQETPFKDLFVIQPEILLDERGSFMRIFCKEELRRAGLDFDIVQMSRSFNKRKGVIRGLHFQQAPKTEGKIVQCLLGKIYDIAADIRRDSPTYGKYFQIELSAENKTILFIPKGFAHGFQTLTDESEIQYSMSEFYTPEFYTGVRWNDPLLNIPWPLLNPILSERDRDLPLIT